RQSAWSSSTAVSTCSVAFPAVESRRGKARVDLARQRLDLLGQGFVLLSQGRVRLDQALQICGLGLDRRLSILHVLHDFFAVRLEVIERVLVSLRLARLRKQDQRRRVGGLGREQEV